MLKGFGQQMRTVGLYLVSRKVQISAISDGDSKDYFDSLFTMTFVTGLLRHECCSIPLRLKYTDQVQQTMCDAFTNRFKEFMSATS